MAEHFARTLASKVIHIFIQVRHPTSLKIASNTSYESYVPTRGADSAQKPLSVFLRGPGTTQAAPGGLERDFS